MTTKNEGPLPTNHPGLPAYETIERAARALWYHGANTGTWNWAEITEDTRERYRDEARAVIAAIHPTVSTVGELDALPETCIVRLGLYPYMKGRSGRWHQIGTKTTLDSVWMAGALLEDEAYTVVSLGGAA